MTETKSVNTGIDINTVDIDALIRVEQAPFLRELGLSDANIPQDNVLDEFQTEYRDALNQVKKLIDIIPQAVEHLNGIEDGWDEIQGKMSLLAIPHQAVAKTIVNYLAVLLSGLYPYDSNRAYHIRGEAGEILTHDQRWLKKTMVTILRRLIEQDGIDFGETVLMSPTGKFLMAIQLEMIHVYRQYFRFFSAHTQARWFDCAGIPMLPQMEVDRMSPWKMAASVPLVSLLPLPLTCMVLDYILDRDHIFFQANQWGPNKFTIHCPFCSSVTLVYHTMTKLGLNPVPADCLLGNRQGFFLHSPIDMTRKPS